MNTELTAYLLKSGIAGAAAIVLVLALRNPVRARFGSSVAYLLWWLLPVAILAALIPARTVMVETTRVVGAKAVPVTAQVQATAIPLETVLSWFWCAGAVLVALLLARQQWRFHARLGPMQRLGRGLQRARVHAGLPAVIGVLMPRIVLPADFESRYSDCEQRLVLQHERVHLRRGDLQVNAAFALLRCLHWFNPLVHIAAECFRRDQELACDEVVVRRHPDSRRAYGEAMLKTQLAEHALPFGCHWHGQHPLKERIAMLKRPLPSRRRWVSGVIACAVLAGATGFSVWAAQPATKLTGSDVRYVVERRSFYGDQVSGKLIQHVPAGKTITSIVGNGDDRWENAMVVTPGRLPGTVTVRMELRHGDPPELVAAPSMILREGVMGSFEEVDDNGRLFYRQEIRVTREAAAPSETPAPAPEPAETGTSSMPSSRLPPPKYPAEAAAGKVSGKVVLIVDVAADGTVRNVAVEKSEPAGVFDTAAVEAAKQWTFNPSMKNGKPVAGRVRVPITFDAAPKAGTNEPSTELASQI